MSRVPGILAIDQGTTGSMAVVVTAEGRVAAKAYSEFTQHFPRPGWVEHDAQEIWEVTRGVARKALNEVEAAVQVEGIGITNQRETLVLWDRETLEPVHRAIVWQDRRTAGICGEFRNQGREEEVRDRTGLLLDPYFSGTKVTWLLREKPELRRRAEEGELAMGTVDSWLLARLTGGAVHATEHTNASRTLLYDLRSRDWSRDLLDLFEVPEALLPRILPSSGALGTTRAETLGAELPVAGMAGDQQAALFGQGCWEAGMAKNTYGTGAFLLLHTGDEPVASPSGLLTTVACDSTGQPAYALEGSIFIAGAAIQWLRDSLGILENAEESESLARSLSSNEGVYFVPAFVGLGAPHWEPEARATLVGLTRGTTRAHLARAALEAMAFSTEEVIRAMELDSGVATTELRVDGGASYNDWLMGFQADILGVPVRRPGMVETTALGAAGLAGLALGVWRGGEEFLGALGEGTTFTPTLDEERRKEMLSGWRRAIGATLAWSRWRENE